MHPKVPCVTDLNLPPSHKGIQEMLSYSDHLCISKRFFSICHLYRRTYTHNEKTLSYSDRLCISKRYINIFHLNMLHKSYQKYTTFMATLDRLITYQFWPFWKWRLWSQQAVTDQRFLDIFHLQVYIPLYHTKRTPQTTWMVTPKRLITHQLHQAVKDQTCQLYVYRWWDT